MRRWLLVAAAAVMACVSSGVAEAALIHVGASGFFALGTPVTAISAPQSIVTFSFDAPAPLTSPDTNITSFSYALNNQPVAAAPASVSFAPSAFTLNFTGGSSLELSSVASSFDGYASGGYLANLQVNGGLPSSQGFVVVSVSPVPLPASLPLFGAGLLALGAFGYLGRRRSAAAIIPASA